MPPNHDLDDLIHASYDELQTPTPQHHDHAGLYGVLGVLVLLTMLLLASGELPGYDWNP